MVRTANPKTSDSLMEAAFDLVRTKGLAATTVDDICAAAGYHWSEVTEPVFAGAAYHAPTVPVQRLLGYVDLRREMMAGDIAAFTCVVGTMAQEAWATSPAVRAAAWDTMSRHAEALVADIEAAKASRGIGNELNARCLARRTVAVVQGALILAKASGDPATGAETVRHLRRYIEQLFNTSADARKLT